MGELLIMCLGKLYKSRFSPLHVSSTFSYIHTVFSVWAGCPARKTKFHLIRSDLNHQTKRRSQAQNKGEKGFQKCVRRDGGKMKMMLVDADRGYLTLTTWERHAERMLPCFHFFSPTSIISYYVRGVERDLGRDDGNIDNMMMMMVMTRRQTPASFPSRPFYTPFLGDLSLSLKVSVSFSE